MKSDSLLFFFFFKQKTAYEITVWLEFRRVLFRSTSANWIQVLSFVGRLLRKKKITISLSKPVNVNDSCNVDFLPLIQQVLIEENGVHQLWHPYMANARFVLATDSSVHTSTLVADIKALYLIAPWPITFPGFFETAELSPSPVGLFAAAELLQSRVSANAAAGPLCLSE